MVPENLGDILIVLNEVATKWKESNRILVPQADRQGFTGDRMRFGCSGCGTFQGSVVQMQV